MANKSAEDIPVTDHRPVAVNMDKGDYYISLTDMLKPLQYIRLIIYPVHLLQKKTIEIKSIIKIFFKLIHQ